MRLTEVPSGSRQRVETRCRTVAAAPTLGPAADVSEGMIVPSSPTDPAVSVHASTGTTLDAVALRAGLERCSRIVARHARHLTRLDAVLGDGDHGDNLVIGLRAVDELLAELPASTPPGEILQAVGHRLVAAVGGASGPLYGTACIEAGFVAGRSDVVAGPVLASMFRAAAAGLARRGRCQPGDKTILDTLAPSADAFGRAIDAGESVPVAYAAALRAGLDGMRSTRDLVARRGLALRLGERSAGHLDPGAVSCLLLLSALGGR
jgi:phosphoenolpyruvate---glycerone phosphotransferase subunit DhaL